MEITDRVKFLSKRLKERLWFKPLVVCVFSIFGVVVAKTADRLDLEGRMPSVTLASIEALLSIMAAGMLVIATFAVSTMVAAYSSASNSATPRSFPLVIEDDISQNALSTFVGAFVFSIVGITAVKNEFFQSAGRATLFILTALVFAYVVFTFVRWIDRVARLGRVGSSIDTVEAAAHEALSARRRAPSLGGVSAKPQEFAGHPLYADTVGYVQGIDMKDLQSFAEEFETRILVAALPGTFVGPGVALAYVGAGPAGKRVDDYNEVIEAFLIGRDRDFDDDPRFGLVVLSEIAGKALSPAINDPGTAIAVIGSFVRLFAMWSEPLTDPVKTEFDRVEVPELHVQDMFDDAFTAIARDGAGTLEVAIRLQKALRSLSALDHPEIQAAAKRHSRLALARAKKKLDLPEDLKLVQEVSESFGVETKESPNPWGAEPG